MEPKILTKNQAAFLKKVGSNDFLKRHFYLTGGTALAAFYLGHRYSEDLDFFSEKEFDLSSLNTFFAQIKKEFGIKEIDFQQSFNRNLWFCHFPKETLKIEFTYFPFPRIEKFTKKEYGIMTDGILDIAVNKLFTIYQRSQARDYIDLYFLCKEKKFLISDLIEKAKLKFDWHIDFLQLGTQFIKAKETKDYPRMIREVRPSVWQSFFLKEAKKLKKEILS